LNGLNGCWPWRAKERPWGDVTLLLAIDGTALLRGLMQGTWTVLRRD
jgi:hypothetical protein